MPLNITSHSPLLAPQGVAAQAPLFDTFTTAQVVALGAQSTLLNGPAMLCLVADEDQRVSAQTAPGYSAPAASGMKLKAGVERYVQLAAGPWYINAIAG